LLPTLKHRLPSSSGTVKISLDALWWSTKPANARTAAVLPGAEVETSVAVAVAADVIAVDVAVATSITASRSLHQED
jgi:hypothetical protein